MSFTCSICEEESTRICVACTKDSCDNHLCEKCFRCSDCCGCEVALNQQEPNHTAAEGRAEAAAAVEPPTEASGMPREDGSGEVASADLGS